MSTKYIIGSLAGAAVIAYVFDNIMADQKIFGGIIFSIFSNNMLFCLLYLRNNLFSSREYESIIYDALVRE